MTGKSDLLDPTTEKRTQAGGGRGKAFNRRERKTEFICRKLVPGRLEDLPGEKEGLDDQKSTP